MGSRPVAYSIRFAAVLMAASVLTAAAARADSYPEKPHINSMLPDLLHPEHVHIGERLRVLLFKAVPGAQVC
jgi:hypothetical protein